MTALSWLLMLCLVHERPVSHLPITVDTSTDSRQTDKKVQNRTYGLVVGKVTRSCHCRHFRSRWL